MRKLNLKKFKFSFFKRLPHKEKTITIPTILTLTRIALSPFIVGAMVTQRWGLAFWLFVIATVSDIIDGYLARLLDQKTFLGAVLDPVADKILIVSCFFTLAFVQSPLFSIPTPFVWFVLGKELLQGAGVSVIYAVVGEIDVKPTLLGRATTAVQITFIMWLFFCYFFHWLPIKTYYSMLGIVVFLVSASFIQYSCIGWHFLKNSRGRIKT